MSSVVGVGILHTTADTLPQSGVRTLPGTGTMSAPQLSKSENKSTDEDYESDDSDVDRLRTRQLDPAADTELLEDLWTAALPAFSCGDGDRARLLAAAASVFVADTAEDGPLAGLFLTDGPSDRNYEG